MKDIVPQAFTAHFKATACAVLILLQSGLSANAQGPFTSACSPGAPAFITSGTTSTGLYSYDPATGANTTIKAPLITSGSNLLVDGIGYNKNDGYVWGHLSGTNQIVRIENDGSTTTYAVSGLPSGTYILGDVSPSGILYLSIAGSSGRMYQINLNTGAPFAVAASPAANTQSIDDWAVNPVDGMLYATGGNSLYKYNTTTGAYTVVGSTGLNGTNAKRQVYFDASGNLFATGNDGTFRIAMPSSGNSIATVYTTNTTNISSTGSDAARCTDATLPLVTSQPTFVCEKGSPAYLAKNVTNDVTRLYSYNPMTGTETAIGSSPIIPEGISQNIEAIAYNPVDNYVWGTRAGTNQIVRIGSDGSSQTFAVNGLPVGTYHSADISPSGIMYISSVGSSVPIYAINLTSGPPYSATSSPNTNTNGIYDWTYNAVDNRLYGVSYTNRFLYSYDPSTGSYISIGNTGLPSTATYNPFFDDSGNLYFAGANGAYRIDNVSASSFTAYQYSSGTTAVNLTLDAAGCRPDLPNKPVGGTDAVNTVGGTPVVIDVAANDVADASYPATIVPQSVVIATQPTKGTVSVNPVTGQVTYTPNVGTFGNDTFTYTVKDNNGLVSAPITVAVSVTQKPFDCPAYGLVFGNGVVRALDLATGQATALFSGNGNINAIGYNALDNYVYGGNTIDNWIVRVGADGSTESINVPGFLHSAIGDISKEGKYYSTPNGVSYSNWLQEVDLNPASPTYLSHKWIQITGQIPTGLNGGGDFSVSPIDGMIYYVGATRVLYRINPVTGVSTALGTSTALTNGQTYHSFMDDAGNYYIVDGLDKVYRIATPHTGSFTATLFASNIPGGSGDGARCPNAPLGPSANDDELPATCSAANIIITDNDIPGSSNIVNTNTRLVNPVSGAHETTVAIAGEGTYVLNPSTGTVTFTAENGFQGNTSIQYVIFDENSLQDVATLSLTINCPLPVTLVKFDAKAESEVTQLTWSTTEETNSEHFEIQRSIDGKNWGKIGSVVSKGESSVLHQYRYTDTAPRNGSNLYRLKMVDKDATFAYSSIKSVHFEGLNVSDAVTYVYPNPSSERLFLNSANISGILKVSVIDLNGRIVLTTKIIEEGISVRSLSTGVYILKVFNADGSTSVHKFLISR